MAVAFCGKRIILTRSCLLKTPRRNGYIVLVPEIGEDLPEKNPLLKEDGLPEFNRLTIEKCIAAIGKQVVECEQGIVNVEERIASKEHPDLFKDVFEPLEEICGPLETTWGLAKLLYLGNQSLMPTKSYLSINDRARRALASKFTSIPIYEACKNAKEDPKLDLNEEQKRIVNKFVLEGKLNGLEVQGINKEKLHYAVNYINLRRGDFKAKLEIATKLFSHTVTDPNMMRDFPEDFLRTIAVDATQPHRGPWNISLQPHIREPFLEYCPDRDLRWNIWQATNRRSAHFVERQIETSTTVEDIRLYRGDLAKFLGYETYAHMSMETKMAGSIENVYNVLDILLERARPAQEQEMNDLSDFAAERGFDDAMQLWDVPYWGRKQRRNVYKYNEDVLKEYFPLPKVLSGMFKLVEGLFDIHILERKKVDVWHEDVRFFDIIDKNGSEPIASFYLDPYARTDEKIRVGQDSGWMVGIQKRSLITRTNPLAALVFNFQPPLYGKPSLLTFNDVHGLFHKFGHVLQHLLTTASYSEVAGSSTLEWDAVEISGHFMANWLYEPSTLKEISSHYDTEESLPEETIECLKNVRSHLSGYTLCKELYLSRLDLELYSKTDFWGDTVKRLWDAHFAFPLDKRDSHPCSFSAIFSDEWGAAYYSHIWAQMVAADAYSAFQEIVPGNDEQQKEVGKRYRETFLSLGGGCHPSQVFRRFRGRDPSPKALLRNLGLRPRKNSE